MANNRFALELLPDTLLVEVAKYLSSSEIANVVMACITTLMQAKRLDQEGYYDNSLGINLKNINLHPFFNSRIHPMWKDLMQAGMCILKGKKDEALTIIDKYDGLFLRQVIPSITLKKYPSHVGEKHVGRNLYQLALRTYDDELIKEIGQRIELKCGHNVKAQQFNEQFPNGVKSTKSYRAVFDSLIKTMAADPTIDFVDGQNIMNNTTKEALQVLENSLRAEPIDQCTTGVPFDLQIVIDFIDAYERGVIDAVYDKEFVDPYKCDKDEYIKYENKKLAQRGLYWRCGFGKLESFMSYFVAMALNEQEDPLDVMRGERKVKRSTLQNDNSDFFDLSLGVSHYIVADSQSQVGFFMDSRTGFGVASILSENVIAGIKNFCRTHIEKLEQLKQQLQQPTSSYPDEENHRCFGLRCQIF